MKNPNQDWKQAVFSRFKDGKSIRTDRYSYTKYSNDKGEVYARMLYDHQKDPYENVNISELPENQQLVKKFSHILKKHCLER